MTVYDADADVDGGCWLVAITKNNNEKCDDADVNDDVAKIVNRELGEGSWYKQDGRSNR